MYWDVPETFVSWLSLLGARSWVLLAGQIECSVS